MSLFFPFANQVLDECDSTNILAKEMAEGGATHGTWISARLQNGGRGRLGRKWESLEGNLFLSMITRIQDKSLWSWLPLTAAVAAVRSLRHQFPSLDLRIKWPNDLWLGNAKLGGILCEGAGLGSNAYVVIGIGLNCNHSPVGMDQSVQNLAKGLEADSVSVDQVRAWVIAGLLEELKGLAADGPRRVKQIYDQYSALSPGTKIEWGFPRQNGVVEGLGCAAELQVRTIEAGLMSLFAEEVKLTILGRA